MKCVDHCVLFGILFLVIANKPKPLPYLDALLPKDYELDSDEEDEDKRFKRQHERRVKTSDSHTADTPLVSTEQSSGLSVKSEHPSSTDAVDSENKIDNPFLRPIVMPKLKNSSRKYR